MESTNDFSGLPLHLQKELRAQLASLNIKLTLASDQLAKEADPARRAELREEIARLKVEARRVAETYTAGGGAPPPEGAAASGGEPADVVLVFAELDAGPSRSAPPDEGGSRGTQPLTLDDLPILFDIEEADRPPPPSGPLGPAPGEEVSPLDEVEITLSFQADEGRPARPSPRGGRIGEALAYAAEAAASRARRDGVPRAFARPLEAAALAIDQGAGEEEVVAAVLNDALAGPDDELGIAAIRDLFGDRVAEVVASGAALKRIDPWQQRDRGYMALLATAAPEAVRVAIRARTCGVAALARQCRAKGPESVGVDERGLERLFWSLRALGKAYRSVAGGAVVDEWDRAVAELERAASRAT